MVLGCRRSGSLWLSLKLNVALLGDRGLLNGNHLPLHLGQLGRRLLVSSDEKSSGPEDDDGCRSGDAIFGALTVLSA